MSGQSRRLRFLAGQRAPHLRDYVRFAGRHWRLITVAMVVAVVLGMAYSYSRSPQYQATIEFAVQPPGESDTLERALFGPYELQTQARIVGSPEIAEPALRDSGLEGLSEPQIREFIEESVEVEIVEGTNVLAVRVTHDDPEMAAVLAQSFAEAYEAHRRQQASERTREAMDELSGMEQSTREQLRSVQEQLADAPGERRDSLEEERDQLYATLRFIAQRRAEISATTSFMQQVTIVDPAAVPEEPVSPQPIRTGALALVLGGLFGTGVAFLREWTDDSIASPVELELAAQAPVLGSIRSGDDRLQRYDAARAAVLHMLRTDGITALHLAPVGRSASMFADRLASRITSTGCSVIVLHTDGDAQSPETAVGEASLRQLLEGDVDVRALARQGVTGAGHPVMVRAGAATDRLPSSDVVASPQMRETVSTLVQEFDLVIIVSPDMVSSAVAYDAAPLADATILVAVRHSTRGEDISSAAESLTRAGGEIAGAILIDVAEAGRDAQKPTA